MFADGEYRMGNSKKQAKERDSRATFIVQIHYRENSTWQGQILWKEENESKPFRSELELIKLIDSAYLNHRM
jgi:hypothetical protein